MYQEERALIGAEAWKERTLVDLLTLRRLTRGEKPIFHFLGDGETVTASMSASELHRQASIAAAHLKQTLPPESLVVLLFENSLDYIIGFFSCLYAGFTPISGVYPTAMGAVERFKYILRDSCSRSVIGKRETLQLFHADLGSFAKELKWIPLESALKTSRKTRAAEINSQSLALIQYTSGSTDNPKGVALTHRNICHNIHTQLISFQYCDDDTGVSWLPFTHDMGLIGAVLPGLASGNPFYFMTPDKFIEKPSRWLSAISRYKAAISGGPDFAYRYCARLPRSEISPDWDLSRWTIAFNGSESITEDTLKAFAKTFKSHGFQESSFYPCYGLAENSLLVTSGIKGHGVKLTSFDRKGLSEGVALAIDDVTEAGKATVLASCGTPWEDQFIFITNPETQSFLPSGKVGEIWIKSPSVCAGYLNDPLRTEHILVEIDGERFLRTQDFGFIHENELYLVGRLSEKFSYDGSVYYTNDISLALSQALERAQVVVVPPDMPSRDLPTLIVEQDQPDMIDVCWQIVLETMKSYRIPLFHCHFIRKGFIIRTPSGKIRADLTLDNILKENTAIVRSLSTDKPILSATSVVI